MSFGTVKTRLIASIVYVVMFPELCSDFYSDAVEACDVNRPIDARVPSGSALTRTQKIFCLGLSSEARGPRQNLSLN